MRFRVNYLLDRQTYSSFVEQLSAGNFTEKFDRDGNLIPGVIPQFLNLRAGYDQPSGPARGMGGFIEDVVSQGFYLWNIAGGKKSFGGWSPEVVENRGNIDFGFWVWW
jgi:hypothetical protein